MFDPVFTSTLVARAELSERLGRLGRERIELAEPSLLRSLRQVVAQGTAKVQALLSELGRWSDSQQACVPGTLVLSEC
jgi:hypothetical protein